MKIKVNLEQVLVLKFYEPLALKIEKWNRKLHCYRLSNICMWLTVFLSATAYLWHLADPRGAKHPEVGLLSIYFFFNAAICLTFEYNAEHIAKKRERDLAFTPGRMNSELQCWFWRATVLSWFVITPVALMIISFDHPEDIRMIDIISLPLGIVYYSALAFRACDPAYLTSGPEDE